jgi:transposase-like protein
MDRKVDRPPKEQLIELMEQKTSWVQMGRMFGVSDNAVRKWAKKYDLLNKKIYCV